MTPDETSVDDSSPARGAAPSDDVPGVQADDPASVPGDDPGADYPGSVPAGDPASVPASLPSDQLRRLHPLTPFLRSWRMIGVAVAIGLGGFRDDLERLRFFWDVLQGDAELSSVVKVAGIVLAVAIAAVVGAWLSWRATGFAIVEDRSGPGTLLFHRGLIVRQRSQVRLNRVQSVDVNQPLFARLCGLAVVRLEMAAGEDASVALSYLGVKDAWAVREEILRHTSGVATREAAATAAPDDELVATVSTARLIKANLLDGVPALLFVVLWFAGLVVAGLVWGSGAVLAGLAGIVPVTLGILVALRQQAASILRDANFRLYSTPNGIRISSGLTSTVNRTIDAERIQGVRIEEPYLWRRFGWVRVEVDVAGAANATNAAPLMPVAQRGEGLSLVRSITGVDLDAGDVRRAGARARTLDPWGASFLGVVLHPHGAVTLRGRWRRARVFVPYARAQSVSTSQGWLQRRLGLASVYLDMPKGVDRWVARHRDASEAADLVAELAARARSHRRVAGSAAPPPTSPDPRSSSLC